MPRPCSKLSKLVANEFPGVLKRFTTDSMMTSPTKQAHSRVTVQTVKAPSPTDKLTQPLALWVNANMTGYAVLLRCQHTPHAPCRHNWRLDCGQMSRWDCIPKAWTPARRFATGLTAWAQSCEAAPALASHIGGRCQISRLRWAHMHGAFSCSELFDGKEFVGVGKQGRRGEGMTAASCGYLEGDITLSSETVKAFKGL